LLRRLGGGAPSSDTWEMGASMAPVAHAIAVASCVSPCVRRLMLLVPSVHHGGSVGPKDYVHRSTDVIGDLCNIMSYS
jgi:hypothetical protein